MARLLVVLSVAIATLGVAQGVAAAEIASGTPVVFTRAAAGGDFLKWAYTAARTDAVLVMYDTTGKPVARYHLENAWPSKVEIGSLNAAGNEISIETLEISHEGMQLETDAVYDSRPEVTGTVSFGGRLMRAVLGLCVERGC